MTTSDWTRLTGHAYDGIEEYDNPTPGWWNWLFAATIAFSVCYWAWYHIGTESSTIEDHWHSAQIADFRRIFGQIGELRGDEASILSMMGNPQMLTIARGIFVTNCAQCHGKDGGGITGVNLTDNVYKNVRSLPDLFTTITKGANNGAMPAWENRLSTNERVILAAFVASLRGSSQVGGRAPEGVEIAPWPAATASGNSETK